MIWLGALLLVAVPTAILTLLVREERRAERTRPPMAWVRRLWHGSVRNRRQHPRHDAAIPLVYRVVAPPPTPAHQAAAAERPAGGGMTGGGVTRDVSLGGVGILLPEKLLPGTAVELRLQCAPPLGTITVRGDVRWVRELPSKPRDPRRLFWVGLQLVASSAISEQQLRGILEQLSGGDGREPHA